MREIFNFFDKLYFTESILGRRSIEGRLLVVPANGLFVLAGHPLQNEGSGPYKGELVFEGVLESRRIVTEYIGNPRKPEGFKAPREIVDEFLADFTESVSSTQKYCFEGYQDEPSAWIDNWTIQAQIFKFRLTK